MLLSLLLFVIIINYYFTFVVDVFAFTVCPQCFDTVGLVAGRASGLLKLSGGVQALLSD